MDFRDDFYPESRFGGFTAVDGTIIFYIRVGALLRATDTVLDVGCGRGEYNEDTVPVRRSLRILKGRCAKVVGVDVDPVAARNPFLDEFRSLEGPRWPMDDASVDLCLADYVLEHVEDPDAFFSEVARVLRPGGHVCIRTPNAWGYIAIASALIPNRHHARVLGKVQEGRQAQDVFPTRYRCNTRRKLRAALRRHGFEGCVIAHEAEPSYLSFSKLAYALGVIYQKLAPPLLRNGLVAFARKVDPGPSGVRDSVVRTASR